MASFNHNIVLIIVFDDEIVKKNEQSKLLTLFKKRVQEEINTGKIVYSTCNLNLSPESISFTLEDSLELLLPAPIIITSMITVMKMPVITCPKCNLVLSDSKYAAHIPIANATIIVSPKSSIPIIFLIFSSISIFVNSYMIFYCI